MVLRDSIEGLEVVRYRSKTVKILLTFLLIILYCLLTFVAVNKLSGGHQLVLFNIYLAGGLVGGIFFVLTAWLWRILP